jgi:hypothetical protein
VPAGDSTLDSQAKADVIGLLTNTPTEEFLARRGELGRATLAAALTTEEINAALAARPDLPRPLLPNERDTLLALLRCADSPGRDQFVLQVDSATVVGYCPCPCATVALDVDRTAPRGFSFPDRTIPTSATVLDTAGKIIGGIIVFVDDGYLSALEIYDYGEPISPLPPLERLELGRFEQQEGRRRWPWIWRRTEPYGEWRPY